MAWDFENKHVQEYPGIYDGKDYISSESIVICAVPVGDKLVTDIAGWMPIGLVENINLQQQRPVAQLFEIGSKKQFQLPGRSTMRAQISRILFNGPSLLKSISAFNMGNRYSDITKGTKDAMVGVTVNPAEPISGNGEDESVNAGEKTSSFFINLSSQYFSRPMNLGLVIKDSENEYYGATVLRECFVQTHNMSISGQQTIVMENVNLSVAEVVPINVGAKSTLADEEVTLLVV